MPGSRKRLIIAETFFQEEVILNIDVIMATPMTILEILNATKVSINQSCGGNGTCGTCRIEIMMGFNGIHEKSSYEQTQHLELQLLPNQRLACQCQCKQNQTEEIKIKIVSEFI